MVASTGHQSCWMGRALTCVLPSQDVSDFRPVPDHQEVRAAEHLPGHVTGQACTHSMPFVYVGHDAGGRCQLSSALLACGRTACCFNHAPCCACRCGRMGRQTRA